MFYSLFSFWKEILISTTADLESYCFWIAMIGPVPFGLMSVNIWATILIYKFCPVCIIPYAG